MALKDDIPQLVAHVQSQASLIRHNADIFDIYEGNLKPHVECALQAQLSMDSFSQAQHRIAPINVLTKIIDKLSTIYQESPTRNVEDEGSESDSELLKWYEETLRINPMFNISNEFSNLFKNNLIQPFVAEDGIPKLRIIPSDSFTVYSDNLIDPTRPTHVITYMGKRAKAVGSDTKTVDIWHVYTDSEFLIVDSEGEVQGQEMARLQGPAADGVNIYGRIPFVYVNKSTNLLIPKPDSDIKAMTILIPVLISDLNYAAMFQTFSIIYTINAMLPEGARMAPNAHWPLQAETDADGAKPEIGTIKPNVDITETLNLIQSELAMWLNTKGIRPGAGIGNLDQESFASGISKMIDESDTFEARNKQVNLYKDVEAEFWELLLDYMHPVWSAGGLVENRALFSPNARVITNFAPQVPLMRRGELVKDLKEEVSAGFATRMDAIRTLNPRLTDNEIDDKIEEIDGERVMELPEIEPQPEPEEEE